jgi:hypothetical protein
MEAACVIAIGVAMVELHGGNRPAGTGSSSGGRAGGSETCCRRPGWRA